MNTQKNTSEVPVNLSRRFFLWASVALVTSTIMGCSSGDFPQDNQIELKTSPLSTRINDLYDYIVLNKINTTIRVSEEESLQVQIGSALFMWDNCLLVQWKFDGKNIDIVYAPELKNGKWEIKRIIKSKQGDLTSLDLALLVWKLENSLMKF